ncbi:MAG: cell envelope integrity protein TolA [Bryobacteraceae bacterium]
MHPDILDERDRLGRPFAGSIVVHVSLFAALIASSLFHARHADFGDLKSGAGTVGVNVVHAIPIPQKAGQTNRLANDTESIVPQAPPQPKEKAEVKPPDAAAIPLPGRDLPKRLQPPPVPNPYRPQHQYAANQVFSRTPEALKSPNMGIAGSGGVGVGPNSPLGARFGSYVALLQERIASKWNTGDFAGRSLRPVVVSLTILRDGNVRNVRVAEPSGNALLDRSAERAVLDASPLPPLPLAFERDEAALELYFQVKQ